MNLDVPRPVHGNFLSTVENRTQHYCQCRGSTWRAQLWIHDGRRTLWRPCASLLRTCACPQSASTDDRGDTLNYLDVVLVPRRLQRFVREKPQTATWSYGLDQAERCRTDLDIMGASGSGATTIFKFQPPSRWRAKPPASAARPHVAHHRQWKKEYYIMRLREK